MAEPPVTYYVVTIERGAHWENGRSMREQAQWAEHARYMDALTEEGFVVLGGPLDNGDQALLVVTAESPQAVEDRLAADPWLPMGVRRIGKIERWEILLRASQ